MAKTSRLLLIFVVVAVVLAAGAGTLFAADDDWAGTPLGKDFRGPGFYLSWVKILISWLVFLLWVYTTNWLNTDCQELKLDHSRWNPLVFGSFMLGFMFLWIIPFFWVGFPLLLVAYVAPFAAYIVKRNQQLDNDRRMFTREHLRFWLAHQLGKMGVKMAAEQRDSREAGAAGEVPGRQRSR